jgi:hypothetical protein
MRAARPADVQPEQLLSLDELHALVDDDGWSTDDGLDHDGFDLASLDDPASDLASGAVALGFDDPSHI